MNPGKYISYAELLSAVNNSCVFLIEYNKRFIYTSPNFNTFFGYDIDKLKDPSAEHNYLEKHIHPEDFTVFAAVQKKLIDFFYTLPVGTRKDYKHIFEFRVLNSNNEYVRVISQHQVLELDQNNNPHIVLGVVDLSPDQRISEGIKFRLVNIKTGDIVPFTLNEKSDIKLTRRETEILKLVNKGMLSKEISESLSISIHTVNNHRQNILQKMNTGNVVEAINQARAWGLLD